MASPQSPLHPPAGAGSTEAGPSTLVGRSTDLVRVLELLDGGAPLVTLTGPAGIGKSALAAVVAAAAVRADGGCCIDLAPLEGVDDMLSAVASALYLPPAAVASPAALVRSLRPLSLLVVLDGADGRRDEVAAMVAAWPRHAPGVRLLVTCRQPLGLPGERVVALAPLNEEAARQLLARTLGAGLPRGGAAADLVRRLGGVPLALQLAAAVAADEGLDRVRDSLQAAVAEGADDGARLAATIDWAHEHLDGDARIVLRRLAVFASGFTPVLAVRVCAGADLDPAAVAAALGRLRARAWVAAAGSPWRLLPALAEAAARHLVAAGEADACRVAHQEAALASWRELFDRTHADPVLDWTQRAREGLPHLRQALRHALADESRAATAIELLTCTPLAWVRLGLRLEGRQWCDRLRALLDRPLPAPLQAAYWLTVATQGVYAFQYGDAETRDALARALPVLRAGDDVVRTSFAIYLEVLLLDRAGRAASAQGLVDEMVALEPAHWSWNRRQPRRNAQALVDRAAGRTAAYHAFCRSELAQQRERGQRAESWTAAHHLALAEQDAGRPAQAVSALDEAYREICASHAQRQFATLIALRAAMLAEQGEPARVEVALAEALPVLQAVGTAWMLDDAWAWRAHHAGRPTDAARLLGRADRALQVRGSAQRSAYLQRSWLALRARLEAALGAAELQRLLASGAGLDADGALALARPPQR